LLRSESFPATVAQTKGPVDGVAVAESIHPPTRGSPAPLAAIFGVVPSECSSSGVSPTELMSELSAAERSLPIVVSYTPALALVDNVAAAGVTDALLCDAVADGDTLKPLLPAPEVNAIEIHVYSESQGAWLPGKLLPPETKPGVWVIEFVKSDGSRSWKDFPVGVSHPHLRGLPFEDKPSHESSDTFKLPASAPKELVTAIARSVPGVVAQTTGLVDTVAAAESTQLEPRGSRAPLASVSYTPAPVDSAAVAGITDDTLTPSTPAPEENVTSIEVYSVSQGAWLPGKLLPLETKPGVWVIEFVKSDGSRSWKDFPVGVSDSHLRGLPSLHEPSHLSGETFKPPAFAPKEEATAIARSAPGAFVQTSAPVGSVAVTKSTQLETRGSRMPLASISGVMPSECSSSRVLPTAAMSELSAVARSAPVDSAAVAGITGAVAAVGVVDNDTRKQLTLAPDGNDMKIEVFSVSEGGWLPGKLLPLETKPGAYVTEFVMSDGSRGWKDFPVGVSNQHLRGLPTEHKLRQVSSETLKSCALAKKEEVTATVRSVPGNVVHTIAPVNSVAVAESTHLPIMSCLAPLQFRVSAVRAVS